MKVGVIGAGIGGLSAACELAKDGHTVTVYEKNANAGGKLNEEIIDGYRFDTGPSLFTMPFVAKELFRYCGFDLSDFIQTQPLTPLCRYRFADGTVFDSFEDRDAAVAAIESIAPKSDAKAYTDFLDFAAKLYERTAQSFIFNPLADIRDLRALRWWDLLRIDAFTTVSDRVDRTFDSDYMRIFFKRFTTYNGSDPWQAPSTLNVIPHVELNQGGYYVKGGLYRIAEALVRVAESLGVQFVYGAEVDKIGHTSGKADHLIIGGERVEFDLIISNSDATHTYTELVSDDVISPEKKAHLASVEPSCSGFVLLLGIDRTYEQLVHHNIFFSSDYRREFDDIFKRGILPNDPTIYVANTSYSDPEHAPVGGSNLFVLVNAPWLRVGDTYSEADLQAYADKIMLTLAGHGLRGLKASVVVQKILSPADFQRLWLSNRGSIYGTSSNHRLAAFMRPRNRSPFLRNLYLVGGSTHPGGGIPLVMLSARHACELVRRDFAQ
jgi:phytoene desaturase